MSPSRFLRCLLATIVALALADAGAAPQVHIDTAHHFRITLLDGWTAGPVGGPVVWSASGGQDGIAECRIEVEPGATPRKQYLADMREAELKARLSEKHADVVMDYFEPGFMLAGKQALHYTFSASTGGGARRYYVLHTTYAGSRYTLTCETAAENRTTFAFEITRVPETFDFLPVPGAE